MINFPGSPRLSLVAAVVLVAALVLPELTYAQDSDTRWRQTVEVITPVHENQVTGAFLDSLVTVIERNDLQVRRSPDNTNPRSFAALENEILNEGVDFTSANRVFITYQFEAGRHGLRSTIEDMYFIYRPEGGADMDIPIMKIDTTQPEIVDLLVNSGMQLRRNEVAFVPFHEQLLFHNLPESTLVALGGDIIRDEQEAEAERQRVLRTVRGFLY